MDHSNSVKNNSVKNNILKPSTRTNATRTRRAAMMLCAVLAGLGLARGAAAQGPQANTPIAPTPYQSPLFHSGGSDPVSPLGTTGGLTVPFGAADPLQLNPLFGQLQGTPTGLIAVGTTFYPLQIPSFLLGTYNPAKPPMGVDANGVTTYYPEHFADGTDPPFFWNAPFDYISQLAGLQVVDDSAGPYTLPVTGTPAVAGFNYTSGWEQVTTDGVAAGTFTGTTVGSPAAGTATNGEYLRLPFATNGTATWQLVEPVAGNYTVNVNIPNDIPDTAGNPEPRSTNVTYLIAVRDTNGAITFSGTANISQTEANANQFLAGPFQVVAGGSVTVTLQRGNGLNNTANSQAGQYYIVADSVSLQVAVGDVQSTPTAINTESYPADFARAKYWGIALGSGTAIQAVQATAALNSVPDTGGVPGGAPVLRTGATATNDPGNLYLPHSDPLHLIRQLVYFGRREPISARSVTADDSQAAFTSNFIGNPIGDASATDGEYRRFGASSGPGSLVGTWTLTAPITSPGAPAVGYLVSVHIPRAPLANTPNAPEGRLSQVTYTVTDAAGVILGGGQPVTISQNTFGTDRIVTLPTGALNLTPGQQIKVNLFSGTNGPLPNNPYVVADSVSLSTGNGQGAIYCVDGFTGGVVWRFETPSSPAGSSTPVYSSPIVAKINVLLPPVSGTTAPIYANKLVVIVGDNNGFLYCLDAIGNGDGTSNANVLDANGQPIYAPQPAYGAPQPAFDPANPHVGTTSALWVYRPDPNLPKNPATGAVKQTPDVNSDLPVPAAFNTASPTVFVDPAVPTAPAAAGTPLTSNATVYVSNSNGVLYALDALGVPTGGATLAAFRASGEKFNSSQDIRRTAGHYALLPNGGPDPQFDAADGFVPTPQPKWWFTLRGPDPNSPDNPSFADIESAPALYIAATIATTTGTGLNVTHTYTYAPTVFIGSAHEMEATSNVGRVYALDGINGPSGNNGRSDPTASANVPGSFNYNVGQRPQTKVGDTAHWSFPDATRARPALGNITGSPVVFTDTNEGQAARRTRVYFAANVGLETTTAGTRATARPDESQGGRLWAVNLDGSVGTTTNSTTGVWSFPPANDPNNPANDIVQEPFPPMGSFLHATPAMGFVRFPSIITTGDGTTVYAPKDVINTGGNGIKGQSVPMLYVGTRGVNDTALYAIDVDGGSDAERQIYREGSPDGSIFQSSPVLITNTNTVASGGGNGGSVFLTGGNTFYDYSATPISSPTTGAFAGFNFPLIRLNKTYTTAGPFSSPTVAATETTDLLPVGTTFVGKTMTDWVYVGDSTTGFCRGFTPNDASDGGIPTNGLNAITPPGEDGPLPKDLTAPLHAYLVSEPNKASVRYSDRLPIGKTAPLPVYEWGQNVYIRFANVVPPTVAGDDPDKDVVFNTTQLVNGAIQEEQIGYGRGGPLEFKISDAAQGVAGADATNGDSRTIPAIRPPAPAAGNPLPDGFFLRTDPPESDNLLQGIGNPPALATVGSGKQYIAAKTYTIADGSASLNTPGSRRHIISASQTVEVYRYQGGRFVDQHTTTQLSAFISDGNVVTRNNGTEAAPNNTLIAIPPVDQPTFGILNPLGVRGGGMDLFGNLPNNATVIGDELGPFRGISTTTGTIGTEANDLKALANGNDIPDAAPPSSGGGGGTIPPTTANAANDPALNPPTRTNVVVTATGLIPHSTSGDNAEAVPPAQLLPPSGSTANTAPDGVSAPVSSAPPNSTFFGSAFAPYAMDLFDRSALGAIAQGIRAKANTVSGGGDAGLYWNDNTANSATNPAEHDSVVNYLPWETPPPVGSFLNGAVSSSQDYPNISSSNVSVILHSFDAGGGSSDMTLGQAFLKRANVGTGADALRTRTVYANPVQFHINVPRYQSANQQLYTETAPQPANGGSNYAGGGQLAAVNPDGTKNTSLIAGNPTFPMGYVTTRRIYVPDRNGFYHNGAAFREVRVYTGVPPDFSTQMADATAAIGKVPSGFGIQTSLFPALTAPYPAPAFNPAGGPIDAYKTFDPYNPAFQDYFKPLNVLNTGNVNLLNVHLDQKQSRPDPVTGAQTPVALSLFSDALDPTSLIPGYDQTGLQRGALTGPRLGRFGANNFPEDYYLIRSSLDTDLVAPYGHNPLIQNTSNTDSNGVPLIQIYPGATFHKAQVGSAQPSKLYLPDAPDSFTPGATLDIPPPSPSASPSDTEPHPTQQTDPNNNQLAYKTKPFVSTAIPFGTPVGSYHGTIQLFEGLDAYGYSDVITNQPGGSQTYTGLIAQICPPRYGSGTGGIIKPTPGTLADSFVIAKSPANTLVQLMPISSTGTTLNVNVTEDRMTDGSTYGGVPMIDSSGAGTKDARGNPTSTPDFAPAAFRDRTSGNLSVYWTSGRTLANSTSPFNVLAANVPFTLTPNGNNTLQGHFLPSDPTQYWWMPFPPLGVGGGTNSGLTITQDAQDLSTIGAFVVNVQSPSPTVPYQNTLLYYPVTPRDGKLSPGTPPQVVTDDPSQVKYGVKGLVMDANLTKFNRNLWAFWTATTRGRTAIYYNSQDPTSNLWVPASGSTTPSTIGLLPIPAGLTAVADPAPLLLFGNVSTPNGLQSEATIEVTYSGTAPGGNVDLYQSRYQPESAQATPGQPTPKPYQLDLVPYPAVTEILAATGQPGGWYQARDVAWSRASRLNLYVAGQPILYSTTNQPQFSRAVFDKASGLLVLTGVINPALNGTSPTVYAFGGTGTPVTVYLDLATGRARFSATPMATVTAFFSPLAKRITNDSRADTGPSTFLDGTYKVNDAAPFLMGGLKADRRWYVWRKSGTGGASASASIYYKTQRLTMFLPSPIGISIPSVGNPPKLLLTSVTIGGTDVTQYVDVDYTRGRIYFPINTNGIGPEGAVATVTYTPADTVTKNNPNGTSPATITQTVQWQDEEHAGSITPADTTSGLNSVTDTLLPIDTIVNENNVSAFLDPEANFNSITTTPIDLSHPHKVWLFWNSTRNGTADVYYETINPLFTAGP